MKTVQTSQFWKDLETLNSPQMALWEPVLHQSISESLEYRGSGPRKFLGVFYLQDNRCHRGNTNCSRVPDVNLWCHCIERNDKTQHPCSLLLSCLEIHTLVVEWNLVLAKGTTALKLTSVGLSLFLVKPWAPWSGPRSGSLQLIGNPPCWFI